MDFSYFCAGVQIVDSLQPLVEIGFCVLWLLTLHQSLSLLDFRGILFELFIPKSVAEQFLPLNSFSGVHDEHRRENLFQLVADSDEGIRKEFALLYDGLDLLVYYVRLGRIAPGNSLVDHEVKGNPQRPEGEII